MDPDLGRRALPLPAGRQRCHALDPLHVSRRFVVIEHVHSVCEFIDQVDPHSIPGLMKREMPRPGAGISAEIRGRRRRKACRIVHTIYVEPIGAEVSRQGKCSGWIRLHGVRMRRFLSIGIHAVALVQDGRCATSKGSVLLQAQGRDGAPTVVRGENGTARGMHGNMARSGGAGGFAVQANQAPRPALDAKRRYESARPFPVFPRFRYRIQKFSGRM